MFKRKKIMFKDKNVASMYRLWVVAGINQARQEFGHPLMKVVSIRNYKKAAAAYGGEIQAAVDSIKVQGHAYMMEKRKHGWVSKKKEQKKSNNTALKAAAVSAIFT